MHAEPPLLSRPTVRVDLSALVRNWRALAHASGAPQTAAVVKADAYGLGAERIAAALAAAGCRSFFVATTAEGCAVRQAVSAEPQIFVLNGPMRREHEVYASHALTPVLNAPWQAELWADAGGGACALHVDTGMNRLGFARDEWADLQLSAERLGKVDLVMSHLACAPTPEHPANAAQLAAFSTIAEQARRVWPQAALSLSNSAGALLGRAYTFDLIRPGIALYGGDPREGGAQAPWRPEAVITVEAPIVQVREAQPGETVGYGGDYTVAEPRRLAIVAAGYADGVLRMSGGRGYAAVGGERAPIVGRISMDLMTIDVTQLEAPPRPGDMAVVLGGPVFLEDQADAAQTISYELLVRLGARCKREYSEQA